LYEPTDHYLAVEKVKKRLAVSEETTHTFHMEEFRFKK
jgi:hypothetical protein